MSKYIKYNYNRNTRLNTKQSLKDFFNKGSRKKSHFLNGWAIKALPPTPLGLNGNSILSYFYHKKSGNRF